MSAFPGRLVNQCNALALKFFQFFLDISYLKCEMMNPFATLIQWSAPVSFTNCHDWDFPNNIVTFYILSSI